MVVEDDLHADLARVGDDLVHDLQAAEALQVGVLAVSRSSFGRLPASNSWLENGRRMALKPRSAIWSIIAL